MENKQVGQVEQVEQVETMKAPQPPSGAEMTKKLLTLTKYEVTRGALLGIVIGSFIDMGIVGFWLRIGYTLAVKTVNNLEELIRR